MSFRIFGEGEGIIQRSKETIQWQQQSNKF